MRQRLEVASTRFLTKQWIRFSVILIIAVLCIGLGSGLTWRILRSETPVTIQPGQQVAQTIAKTVSRDDIVLTASGGYIPGEGIFLYTQLHDGGSVLVRAWATNQLLFFSDQLVTLPGNESLVWLIDYGPNQEMIQAPLAQAADPTTHQYVSLVGVQREEALASEDVSNTEGENFAEEVTTTESVPATAVADTGLPEDGQENPIVVEDVNMIQPTVSETVLLPATEIRANFDNGLSPDWTSFSGSWEVIDGEYHQTDEQGFDFGTVTNFQGDDYSMTARVRHVSGEMGAGFYYNMSHSDNKSASQMFNLTQGGTALQWGHFDEAGEFVYEDASPIPNVADGDWHTLQLIVQAGTATIVIDGEIVVSSIHLTYNGGYVGLLASQSHVIFDDVEVVPQHEVRLGETMAITKTYDFEDGDVRDWLAFAGDWVVADGRYEQQQQTEWDRIAALNTKMVGPYRFSTQMLFVEGDMGGGLIFNMQHRDSKVESHMISFTGMGTFLQWGSFDSNGIFIYQDGTPVPNVQDGAWHELALEVNDETYTILLDGVTIVTDVPLLYPGGFIGLFDGRSWVAYDDVNVIGPAQSIVVAADANADSVTEETPIIEDSTITPVEEETESVTEETPLPEETTITEPTEETDLVSVTEETVPDEVLTPTPAAEAEEQESE
jgi:hypothetical protein